MNWIRVGDAAREGVVEAAPFADDGQLGRKRGAGELRGQNEEADREESERCRGVGDGRWVIGNR